MYADIDNTIKDCSSCLVFQQTQPIDKLIPHELSGKPWEVIGADLFSINNKNSFCSVDYLSKFSIEKWAEKVIADKIIASCKVVFTEYWLPKVIT